MSRVEELRSTAENTQASISNRVDALARLLEEDTERSCVDLRVTANVVTAVAKALGPAKALVVSYRLADDVRWKKTTLRVSLSVASSLRGGASSGRSPGGGGG
jgi:hypothetical protein